MDNATHTLCGLALARAGLDRFGPAATVTAVIAANLPDLDIVVHPLLGKPGYLCYHRGITHALLGLAVESLLLATVVWFFARKWHPDTRWSPFWLCAALGLASHLGLDALNTYGVRPFLPFSERWYYGDAAFIMEPVMWLGFSLAALGASPTPLGRGTRNAWLLWSSTVFTVLLFAGKTPWWTAAVWAGGVAAGFALRSRGLSDRQRRRVAVGGIALALAYPLLLTLPLNRAAGARARAYVEQVAGPVASQTVHPQPAAPWRQRAVVSTPERTYVLEVNLWTGELEELESLERRLDHPLLGYYVATQHDTPEYLAWRCFAREPFVAEIASRTLVLGDARYVSEPTDAWCNVVIDVPDQ
ncbi:MAG: metal-dependent hydrolase [Planctomycetota bacterium]